MRSRVRPRKFVSSTLRFAAICDSGTVGLCAKYAEPSSPDSSAVTKTKSSERFGLGCAAAACAMASTDATPDALSNAPL